MSLTVPAVLRRWLVPLCAGLAVIGGGVAVGLVTAAADPSLPPRSAEELLTDLLTADPDGLEGTVEVRSDLGLPPLPLPSAGSADLGSLASGTHTFWVWYARPGQARLELRGQGVMTDVITDGEQLWIWSSRDNTAVHSTLPEGGLARLLGQGGLGGLLGGGTTASDDTPSPVPSGLRLTPDTLARLVVAYLRGFTDITVDSSATVAGRDAYELVLTPQDSASLIDSIVIDVDAQEKIPLRVAVNARGGGKPAIEVTFTEIRFTRPEARMFLPPQGATVVEAGTRTGTGTDAGPDAPAPVGVPGFDHGQSPDGAGGEAPFAVLGTGWTMVLVARLPEGEAPGSPGESGLLRLLPTVEGDWGSGRLLSTRLFSVLLTDDGRVLIGAVEPERLYEAAADPAAAFGS